MNETDFVLPLFVFYVVMLSCCGRVNGFHRWVGAKHALCCMNVSFRPCSVLNSLIHVENALHECQSRIDNFARDLSDKNSAEPIHLTVQETSRLMKCDNTLHHRLSNARKFTKWRESCDDVGTLLELQRLDENCRHGFLEEATNILKTINQEVDDYEMQQLFTGKYDGHGCMLSINSGLGGSDAEDWVSILQRMYCKYAEAKRFSVNIVEDVRTDVGIKSTLLKIEGSYAYGHLNGEKGTHRLVRISPFNALGKRQTSFAAVSTWPILEDLQESAVPLSEKVSFVLFMHSRFLIFTFAFPGS